MIVNSFKAAIYHHSKKNFLKAKEIYEMLLKTNPNNFDILQNYAVLLSQIKEYKKADVVFKKCLEDRPKDSLLLYNYGKFFHDQKIFDKAIKFYKESFEVNPKSDLCQYNIGNIYFSEDKFKEAITYFKKAIEINPSNFRAYNNIGIAHKGLGNFEDALKFYKEAINKNNNYVEGRVTFGDVTFGYDKSKPVLHEINLDVKPGEMIGLVGKSGVGKTTTVNLICRFYEVDRGTLEIDGVDIKKVRLEDVRQQIGIVLQEPFLFSGTIAENIGYGKPGAHFDEILAAAQTANAHDFIVSKPDGYDTQVGERGASLSGGERQRVSLARAILHNPRILILDEATSSVDVQTEKKIQEAIGRLVKGRTTFAIAHRLSTLRNANRLVVPDAGRIVEAGTHEELMANRGPFYNLVQLQQQVSEIIAVKE